MVAIQIQPLPQRPVANSRHTKEGFGFPNEGRKDHRCAGQAIAHVTMYLFAVF